MVILIDLRSAQTCTTCRQPAKRRQLTLSKISSLRCCKFWTHKEVTTVLQYTSASAPWASRH